MIRRRPAERTAVDGARLMRASPADSAGILPSPVVHRRCSDWAIATPWYARRPPSSSFDRPPFVPSRRALGSEGFPQVFMTKMARGHGFYGMARSMTPSHTFAAQTSVRRFLDRSPLAAFTRNLNSAVVSRGVMGARSSSAALMANGAMIRSSGR